VKPERWRLFVAVPVADTVKAAIARLVEGTDIAREFKCPGAEKIHLTVRFFGGVPARQVPDLQARLTEVCHRFAPFKLRAEGLGQFGRRILWVGLRGDLDSLHQLASEVATQTAGFGGHTEERAFAPHITIGRRSGRLPQHGALAGLIDHHRATVFGAWSVERLELIRSVPAPHGATYSRLAEMPLAARACA